MPDSSELPIGWYDDDDGVRRYWDGATWRTPVTVEPERPSTSTEPSARAAPSASELRWPEEAAAPGAPFAATEPRELPIFAVGTVLAVLVPFVGLFIGLWARREYSGSIRQSVRASGIVKLSIGFLIAQTVILAIGLGLQAGRSADDARTGAYGGFCSVIDDNASTFTAVIDWPHNHTTYDDTVNAYLAQIPTMHSIAQQLRTALPTSPSTAVTDKLDRLDLTLTRVQESLEDGSFINSNQLGNELRDSASAVRSLLDSRFCG